MNHFCNHCQLTAKTVKVTKYGEIMIIRLQCKHELVLPALVWEAREKRRLELINRFKRWTRPIEEEFEKGGEE